jgi:acetylornithine/succinyldiaminopimelate/putrescine aminotransferase
MGRDMVMANVMTPSLAQKRLSDRLLREIGHMRGSCPLPCFVCLNSGSEAVTLTARIVDIHARHQTDPGGAKAGRTVKTLALTGGFHGRTNRPALMSESTRAIYEEHLASFRDVSSVVFVDINDETALTAAFEAAERDGVFLQAFYIEPVMGEGVPGLAVTRQYYDLARRLTADHGSLLVVDSIQAALRAQGCLSIIDYPGFEDCAPPDMETFSKALNAGQYPLSVVAMREEVAEIYVTGVYGNTMTTNPKALAVACHVLDSIDDAMREHIRRAGALFKEKLEALAARHEAIVRVDGTGLMLCAHLDPERASVTGHGGFEELLRVNGIEMIHGGDNGLRFTPHFAITEREIDLILGKIEWGLGKLAGEGRA